MRGLASNILCGTPPSCFVIFYCLGSRAGWETELTHVMHVILSSVRYLVKVQECTMCF
jgi:hypothetical protein